MLLKHVEEGLKGIVRASRGGLAKWTAAPVIGPCSRGFLDRSQIN